ncbi:MAG: 4-alpha-glucanotransferase [Bacteriovoracaceae bacterium]|nr:4-alpha-glucanotransferase [Bacteriovoracaceae bacterium]
MQFQRSSGILLPLFSLPSPHGIGDMGPSAYKFVDWLESSAQEIWQMLPFAMANNSGCPYSSYSAFGGYPLLISPEKLYEEGLLSKTDIEIPNEQFKYKVDYSKVHEYKHSIFKKAFNRFKNNSKYTSKFEAFLIKENEWINDLAMFLVLTSKYGNNWNEWPAQFRNRNPRELKTFSQTHQDEILYHQFLQFFFFLQWNELKTYANSKKVKLIGDIPIFVNYHSMDVWKHRLYFKLDQKGHPYVRTGAPPDDFSKTGQYWGNPSYDWKELEHNEFDWWIQRINFMLSHFDIIRLDHFRGFAATWEIPSHSVDARDGWWSHVPGHQFFNKVREKLGSLPLIAEDLGKITPDVHHLRDTFKFPGMKILQFAFGKGDVNHHLPHNFGPNTVVYTGTHDNQTTNGWFWNLPDDMEKNYMLNYSGAFNHDNINWTLINLALSSPANLAIIPLADIIGLGNEARINTPSTVNDNWNWRFNWDQLKTKDKEHLKRLSIQHNRCRDK